MKNNVKQSDWYIGKYGTQSEVTENSATASVKVPTFAMSLASVDDTQTADSSFFKNVLAVKGLTLSEPTLTTEPTKKVYEKSATASRGFTASFAEVVKMKLSNIETGASASATASLLPFQQKIMSRKVTGNVVAPFASKARKFFSVVPSNLKEQDLTDFQDFVAELEKTPRVVASGLIRNKKVTINDLTITDVNYTLKSGDVVRVGLTGHFINNDEGIAVVK